MTRALPFITLIGCGNLGGAMLRRWIKSDIAGGYAVLKPNPLPPDLQKPNVMHIQTPELAAPYIGKSDVVVMAVKPQIMAGAAQSIAPFVRKDTLILSVAAGWDVARFEAIFGPAQPVIRALPNLGAQIGKSITPVFANKNVSDRHKDLTEILLKSIGAVEWINDEDLMHAISAITASGPAFLALFMEALMDDGINAGIDPKTAEIYARHMVIGTASIFETHPDITPAQLRERVSSPGGMTLAGLAEMNPDLPRIINNAIKAAATRSRELGKV
jgi:pyrroline-5-carboxylate reductase